MMDQLKITADQIQLELRHPQGFLQSYQKFLTLFR